MLNMETDVVPDLPIKKYEKQIVEAVRRNQVVVIHGDTGSGKTTQIPQYLLEAKLNDDKMIGITQPRKIGAVNMAKRVAEERNCALGKEVGYEIRFDNKSGGSTKIKYMTDGILLNQCVKDRNLCEYGVVMIDEAHERMLRSDVLLGMLKSLVTRNCNLKVIITSATLDTDKFSRYFNQAPVIKIEGALHEVREEYLETGFPENYVKEAVEIVRKIHQQGDPGDVLVFLTGREEIENCLEQMTGLDDLEALPLYSSLEYEEQQRIFEPLEEPGRRKVVVATNIAETSITIPGVRFVIDCGYVKQSNYSARTKMEVWEEVKVSRAQADQRKGRAGRTAPGVCYRMYSRRNFDSFPEQARPEMARKNLAEVFLKVHAFGLDPLGFEFIDSPDHDALVHSRSQLRDLGFLDEYGRLTKDGESLLDLPVEPMLGKVLLASVRLRCVKRVTTILAMLTEENVFIMRRHMRKEVQDRQKRFFHETGDSGTLYNVFQGWKESDRSETWCADNFIDPRVMEDAEMVQNQLESILRRQIGEAELVDIPDTIAVQKAVQRSMISGFYMNMCRKSSRYNYQRIVDQQIVYIHPSSSLFSICPPYVLYFELKRQKKVNMFGVMKVDQDILQEFPREMEKIGIQL